MFVAATVFNGALDVSLTALPSCARKAPSDAFCSRGENFYISMNIFYRQPPPAEHSSPGRRLSRVVIPPPCREGPRILTRSGCRRTLGGPMPAADVDLTLIIREGQNSVGQNDHRIVPGGAATGTPSSGASKSSSRDRGVSAEGSVPYPREPWRGGQHLARSRARSWPRSAAAMNSRACPSR
jgi:hypothetical protein